MSNQQNSASAIDRGASAPASRGTVRLESVRSLIESFESAGALIEWLRHTVIDKGEQVELTQDGVIIHDQILKHLTRRTPEQLKSGRSYGVEVLLDLRYKAEESQGIAGVSDQFKQQTKDMELGYALFQAIASAFNHHETTNHQPPI